MIVYKDILNKLSDAGWNSTRIRDEKLIGQSTLTNIRNGESFSINTLDKLCKVLDCQVIDLIEYKRDD